VSWSVQNSDSLIIACSPELCKGISVNKSKLLIQNPLLSVTKPRTRDKMESVKVPGGPEDCETSRLPHLLDNRLTESGDAFSPTRWGMESVLAQNKLHTVLRFETICNNKVTKYPVYTKICLLFRLSYKLRFSADRTPLPLHWASPLTFT
jgi:hypothetical protein